MWPEKISVAMYGLLTPFSRILIFLGGICLTAMMFLTACDVTMRYFWGSPIDGAFDVTEYLMVIVFAFALPYCTIHKDHITVDILTGKFPKKIGILLDCLNSLISLVLFSLIAWQSLVATKIQFDSHIVSSVLLIPRYPFFGLLFFGYLCFAVILLAEFFALIAEVERK